MTGDLGSKPLTSFAATPFVVPWDDREPSSMMKMRSSIEAFKSETDEPSAMRRLTPSDVH